MMLRSSQKKEKTRRESHSLKLSANDCRLALSTGPRSCLDSCLEAQRAKEGLAEEPLRISMLPQSHSWIRSNGILNITVITLQQVTTARLARPRQHISKSCGPDQPKPRARQRPCPRAQSCICSSTRRLGTLVHVAVGPQSVDSNTSR